MTGYWKKDIEKFILSLGKGVMCYEYFDLWDKFDETLPTKRSKL